MNIQKIATTLLFCGVVFIACTTDDGGDTNTNQDNFNRSAMLVNWADNIIIPSYTALNTQTVALLNATTTFTDTPSVTELQNIRAAWLNAYVAFQSVSMFEIGKAEEARYRNRLNIYPTNPQEIEGFITDASWDLTLPSTVDAQGFPALDYLLHGLGQTDEEIIAFYTTNGSAANYKNYLLDVSTEIAALTQEVLNDWNTGYREAYIANTASSASGSVDKTANAFLFYYEKFLRAGKVGIPAGVFSNGGTLPNNVEALYKRDISKLLFDTALNASQNFFNGRQFAGTTQGESFKTYLDFLNTIKNGEDLSALINTQFDVSRTMAAQLDNDFTAQIETDNSKMLATYDELQRNVVLMKVDMLQALSIDVDFVDADGD